MKIWFDTEFIEDGKTIDLMSIGMVREDGETYYAESSDCDLSKASPWVKENVIPNLLGGGGAVDVSREYIAKSVLEFAGESPEFWAYFADYDWVALCQLYGTMMDLPEGWPMFCMDVQQVRMEKGIIELPENTGEHNALSDAIWTKRVHEWILRH